jgi:hypothetical protein
MRPCIELLPNKASRQTDAAVSRVLIPQATTASVVSDLPRLGPPQYLVWRTLASPFCRTVKIVDDLWKSAQRLSIPDSLGVELPVTSTVSAVTLLPHEGDFPQTSFCPSGNAARQFRYSHLTTNAEHRTPFRRRTGRIPYGCAAPSHGLRRHRSAGARHRRSQPRRAGRVARRRSLRATLGQCGPNSNDRARRPRVACTCGSSLPAAKPDN